MMAQKKKKWIGSLLILIGFCVSINSCKSDEEIKYEQYVITGKTLYETNCANCHGKNGEGLRALFPALKTSQRLGDIDYLTCIIKNGTTDAETPMPANSTLYNLDIAQIITYLNSRWGKEKRTTETEEVAKVKC